MARPVLLKLSLTLAVCSALGLGSCGDKPTEEGKQEALVAQDGSPVMAAEAPKTPEALDLAATSLHPRLTTIDTHVDIPTTFATEAADPGQRNKYQVDLVKMTEGNLNTVFFIAYVGQKEKTPENFEKAVKAARVKFDAIKRMTEFYPNRIELARTADDIERIREEGKLAALIGVENGFAFGKDTSTVEEYYQRGMRYAGFAHMGHSNFADSSVPREHLGDGPEEHGGLSDLGKQLLAELNRLGVMADVSHASKAATLQMAELSQAPIIASHSGVKAVADHPRNLTDEELVAIAETGGVVQLVALDIYVKVPVQDKRDAIQALKDKYGITTANRSTLPAATMDAYRADVKKLHATWPRANVSDFVDHIDYAVSVIGIDHVGIASDFDGGGGISGWQDASETRNVTKELLKRGYSEASIEKIWSGNFLRVMRAVEARSKELQNAEVGGEAS